jgi:predicted choloylglycine hydrolase
MGEILKRTNCYPPKYPQDILEKSHAYEEQVGIFAPDLLDEFRGIADALEIDYYIPITLETTPYRFQMTSCVVLAISGEHTQSDMPVLAHNQEWMERDSENLRVCYTRPEGKLSSLGFTFHWPLVSRYGGINEAGLAFSMASASFVNSGPGVMLNMAARWILDTCSITEEAVAYLENIPKVWGETYLIFDKENTIAKVEAHKERTMVTYSETGYGWNSLMYDSPGMQPYLDKERIASFGEFASTRKAFLDQWFSQHKGKITDEAITDFLKNHEHKMCYHDLEGLEICWSYLLKIGESDSLLCVGSPCKNPYVEIPGV